VTGVGGIGLQASGGLWLIVCVFVWWQAYQWLLSGIKLQVYQVRSGQGRILVWMGGWLLIWELANCLSAAGLV